ncbi:hypothetical protein D3C80_1486410 [compost metagenome]
MPGWALQAGRSRTDWNVPVAEVVALGEMFGVELSKVAPLTPKQAADKLKRAGIDDSVIGAYSATQPGAVRLVQESKTLAKKAFGA